MSVFVVRDASSETERQRTRRLFGGLVCRQFSGIKCAGQSARSAEDRTGSAEFIDSDHALRQVRYRLEVRSSVDREEFARLVTRVSNPTH